MVVIWSKSAINELGKAYKYIAEDSLQNAKIVKDTLIQMTADLSNNPEKHQIDKLKIDNDGTWRAFEKFHYRISYRIVNNEVRIVRVRHTSKSPLQY